MGARTQTGSQAGHTGIARDPAGGGILGGMARAGQARHTGALLAEGGAALQRGDWAAGRALFAEAVEREDTPEARYGLARACEWAGEFAAAVRSYELAYAGYRARGELRLPALIAGRELAFLHAA